MHKVSVDKRWPNIAAAYGAERPLAGMLSIGAYQLLARARQLSTGDSSERKLALILAISACDMHIEWAMTELFRNKGSSLNDVTAFVGHTMTLASLNGRKIYKALTQDMPWGDADISLAPAAWWDNWIASRNIRQAVAHAGRMVELSEADLCIKSSVSYFAHISEVVERLSRSA